MKTHQLIQCILDRLFKPEYRRLNEALKRINSENKKLTNSTIDGFLYRSSFFIPKISGGVVAGKFQNKNTLHPSLRTNMESYWSDRFTVFNDKGYISQTLFHLLRHTNTPQDIRDALPECLIRTVPEYKNLVRKNQPAFTIQDDPRLMRQYEEALPKMELYAAGALFY